MPDNFLYKIGIDAVETVSKAVKKAQASLDKLRTSFGKQRFIAKNLKTSLRGIQDEFKAIGKTGELVKPSAIEKTSKQIKSVQKSLFDYGRANTKLNTIIKQQLATQELSLKKVQKAFESVGLTEEQQAKLSAVWAKSRVKNLQTIGRQLGLNEEQTVRLARVTGTELKTARELGRAYGLTAEQVESLKDAKFELGRTTAQIQKSIAKYQEMERAGYRAVSKSYRKRHELLAQEAKLRLRSGEILTTTQQETLQHIIRTNEALKRHGTIWGRTRASMERVFSLQKKIGIGFLTTIGPLFLVSAALRTVSEAAHWAFDPFIQFEDALFELRKTADLSVKSMLNVGDAITRMSENIPLAATDLANIAVSAGRLGIKGTENILKFTESIAKLSIATTLTANQAAEALAKIREAFGLPISQIGTLGAILNELENTTATTVEELVKGMRNIGAAGKQLGITADEAAALAATLISAGMNSERAGTRLRRMFTLLAQHVAEITVFMGDAGEQWRRAIEEDPMKALLMYIEKLREIPSNVERTQIAHEHFGEVAGFAIATLTENYAELTKNLETARKEVLYGTSLQKEFAIATKKTSARLQLLNNRAEAARRELGESLVPALISTKSFLASATEAAADLAVGLFGVGSEAKYASENLNELVKQAKADAGAARGEITSWMVFTRTLKIIDAELNGVTLQSDKWHDMNEVLRDDNLRLIDKLNLLYPLLGEYNRAVLSLNTELEESGKRTEDLMKYLDKLGAIADEQSIAYSKLGESLDEHNAKSEKTRKIEEVLIEYSRKEGNIRKQLDKQVKEGAITEQEATKIKLEARAAEAKARQEWRQSMKADIETRIRANEASADDIENYNRLIEIEKAYNEVQAELNKTVKDGTEGTMWDITVSLKDRLIKEEDSAIHQQLVNLLGEETIKRWKLTDAYKNLLDAGYDIVAMNGELYIVENKNLDATKTLTDINQKYGSVIKDRNYYETLLSRKIAEREYYTRELKKAEKELYNSQVDLFESARDIGNAYDDITSSYWDMYSIAEDLAGTLGMPVEQVANKMGMVIDIGKEATKTEEEWAKITIKRIASLEDEINTIQKLAEEAIKHPKEAGKYIEEMGRTLPDVYKTLYGNMIKARGTADRESWETAKHYLDDYVSYVKGVTIDLPGAKEAWEESSKAVKDNKSEIETLIGPDGSLTKVLESIETILQNMLELPDATSESVDAMYNKLGEAYSLAKEVAKPKEVTFEVNDEPLWDAWSKAKAKIEQTPITVTFKPSFEMPTIPKISAILKKEGAGQTGISNVPRTGLYLLHRGEEVIPKYKVEQRSANINVNVNFTGTPPAGLSTQSIKEIIRQELSDAVNQIY